MGVRDQGRAVAAGVVAATAVAVTGWPQTGVAALAWAVLVGTIVAFLMG
ncbi:hypothetical protein AB0C98_31305 [Streptomyces sp. NPDC048558]